MDKKKDSEFYSKLLTNLYVRIESTAMKDFRFYDNNEAMLQISRCLAYMVLKERYDEE